MAHVTLYRYIYIYHIYICIYIYIQISKTTGHSSNCYRTIASSRSVQAEIKKMTPKTMPRTRFGLLTENPWMWNLWFSGWKIGLGSRYLQKAFHLAKNKSLGILTSPKNWSNFWFCNSSEAKGSVTQFFNTFDWVHGPWWLLVHLVEGLRIQFRSNGMFFNNLSTCQDGKKIVSLIFSSSFKSLSWKNVMFR